MSFYLTSPPFSSFQSKIENNRASAYVDTAPYILQLITRRNWVICYMLRLPLFLRIR